MTVEASASTARYELVFKSKLIRFFSACVFLSVRGCVRLCKCCECFQCSMIELMFPPKKFLKSLRHTHTPGHYNGIVCVPNPPLYISTLKFIIVIIIMEMNKREQVKTRQTYFMSVECAVTHSELNACTSHKANIWMGNSKASD